MFIVELFELWVVVSRESARGTGMRGVLMNHVNLKPFRLPTVREHFNVLLPQLLWLPFLVLAGILLLDLLHARRMQKLMGMLFDDAIPDHSVWYLSAIAQANMMLEGSKTTYTLLRDVRILDQRSVTVR